jgi:outer membrane protein assembly factor BamB
LAAVLLLASPGALAWAAPADEAGQILSAAGVKGGLVVHIGCGDGKLTAALRAGDAYVVHGLDADAKNIEAARKHIQSLGLYGPVSVEQWIDPSRLPYADSLVNLVVISDSGLQIPEAEVLRVLAPLGVAYVKGKDGAWTKTVKPRPKDIDEWTHYLHGPDGNAVAQDSQVGPPRHLQWLCGPKRARDHDALASLSALVSACGRIFYILDEGPTSLIHRPAQWRLIARDAFNGVLLWKREIPEWMTHLYYFRSGPAQLPRRLVAVKDRVYATLGLDAPVTALDAATGRTLLTYQGSEKTEEIICDGDTLLAVIGEPDRFNREADKVVDYWELTVDRPPGAPKSIAAYRAATGERLWTLSEEHLKFLAPLSLAAAGGRAFYMDDKSLYCVDLKTGRGLWQAPCPAGGLFLNSYAPTVVVSGDVVLCLTLKQLAAFSVADGRKLWQQKGYLGFASPGSLFVVGGLAWTIPETASISNGTKRTPGGKAVTGIPIPREDFLGNNGNEIWGLDLHSGAVAKSFRIADVLTSGHHHRCYRDKATERYLICGRRGVEFVDLAGNDFVHNWWIRGECQYGIMPANGLLYRPPDPCQCFNLIKMDWFCALAPKNSLDSAAAAGAADDARLVTGPAYAGVPAPPAPSPQDPASAATTAGMSWHPPVYGPQPEDWPTYRHDITRSGSTPTLIGARLQKRWQADVGGRLSSGVVADGKLLISSVDSATVHCLDAATGRPLWQFTAGGRVDSPPTVDRGLVLFGSADGWVWCLRAADGALAWRFRGAPVDRRVVVDDRLESPWPVSGSVLVADGVAYFAAGRSSYLDGGIRLYGLDAATGRKRCEATVAARAERVGEGKAGAGGESTGALADILVSDGQLINMRHIQFDRSLVQRDAAELRTLFTTTGFLEDCWFHRLNWGLGLPRAVNSRQQAGGIAYTSYQSADPFGKLIVFDGRCAYGVQNPYTVLKYTPSMYPPTHEGHLHQKYSRYSTEYFPIGVRLYEQASRPDAGKGADAKGRSPKKAKGAPAATAVAPAAAAPAPPAPAAPAPAAPAADKWAEKEPLQVRAMVLAGDVLLVAGWMDVVAIQPKSGAPVGAQSREEGPAALWAVSPADGSILARYKLDASPAWDGMFAARGNLYLALKNGTVLCLGAANEETRKK